MAAALWAVGVPKKPGLLEMGQTEQALEFFSYQMEREQLWPLRESGEGWKFGKLGREEERSRAGGS